MLCSSWTHVYTVVFSSAPLTLILNSHSLSSVAHRLFVVCFPFSSVVGVCDLLRQMPDRIKGMQKQSKFCYRESNLKRIIWHRRQSLSFTSCASSFISHLLKPNILLLLSMIVLPFSRSKGHSDSIFIRPMRMKSFWKCY